MDRWMGGWVGRPLSCAHTDVDRWTGALVLYSLTAAIRTIPITQSRYLSGVGVAKQRKAIMDGLVRFAVVTCCPPASCLVAPLCVSSHP